MICLPTHQRGTIGAMGFARAGYVPCAALFAHVAALLYRGRLLPHGSSRMEHVVRVHCHAVLACARAPLLWHRFVHGPVDAGASI